MSGLGTGRSHARLPDVDQAILNLGHNVNVMMKKTSAPLLAAKI
jgi:hypothetical protein